MPPKKPTGLTRIINAAGYSFAGIKTAWKYEAAFRQEIFLMAVLVPTGLYFGQTRVEKVLLISSLMVVILTEFLNSAVEAVVDRIGLEYHPMSERAKDLGSSAVFVSIAFVIIVWALILI
ncbi:MAG: diacylglycerol kinase [Desulfobacula sp.]|jgi:diacylglycerol kinase (ATP)|uniref:diacylglycerol kinase n=1 Tax=Desulfobacula sp. TaxID=2593537 RepID=UPI001DF8782B|nr:diacylglycerol kinase [Desulfobacula sp.]MBT3484036.1 diacylglycerol kinase [Desulfobacula sp.]MBT3805978.1 diacylglycerol kinase [Desulfobacula sp.]MBT4026337.1 diacylglycerol kinase [Desulfobacula sp.]MBT4198118.1 diacylglycerol kinase [Desulfobacula sp.]